MSSRQWQPSYVDDLIVMIREFEETLPGWWWSLGNCHVSRDASCGPDSTGPDADLLEMREFDSGFHCDSRMDTLASSLRNVMEQALAARGDYRAKCSSSGG